MENAGNFIQDDHDLKLLDKVMQGIRPINQNQHLEYCKELEILANHQGVSVEKLCDMAEDNQLPFDQITRVLRLSTLIDLSK